jgi:hypothetical protein
MHSSWQWSPRVVDRLSKIRIEADLFVVSDRAVEVACHRVRIAAHEEEAAPALPFANLPLCQRPNVCISIVLERQFRAGK